MNAASPHSPSAHSQATLRQELRARLLSLPFHAFARCLADLVLALGYEDVALAGRTEWKGRNTSGGFDLVAWASTGLSRHKVLVGCKQYDALPIHQRAVDELRGACLREGAHEALLLTTSTFSRRVVLLQIGNRESSGQIVPVRLLDGEGLLERCLRHHIGVQEVGTPGRLVLDHAYFDSLRERFPGNSRSRSAATPHRAQNSRARPTGFSQAGTAEPAQPAPAAACVTVLIRLGEGSDGRDDDTPPASRACTGKGKR